MIRISQLKLLPNHTEKDLEHAVQKALRLSTGQKFSWEIIRQSIDARKKPDIYYVYTVDVSLADGGRKSEEKVLQRARNKNAALVSPVFYHFPKPGTERLEQPPVIVGTGPAGLFCGLMLARAGYRPILLERGMAVEERQKCVEQFWNGGQLNEDCNVQFGEGGAGTFSDGKLNTLVKDPNGRIRYVLENFVQAGAEEDILYSHKPHIGTDVLAGVVRHIRQEIQSLGGNVLFGTKLADAEWHQGENGSHRLYLEGTGVTEKNRILDTQVLVLAIGHSARDTFRMLHERSLEMTAKAFAVGVRVEHRQSTVNEAMYGKECRYEMPPAPYKVTHRLENGRGVYSFCMCPGGYVVNASSEQGMLAVNGMSYHDRDGDNANSAIVVTVSPEDFGGEGPLCGLEFQRQLEKNAFRAGEGKIPVQRFEDFKNNCRTEQIGQIVPQMKGEWQTANVRQIFPEWLGASIEEGIMAFNRQIPGFSDPDALVSGVESRTSSPVRIIRDECCESAVPGIYPCGEGAGYAGGITSAAIDGIRVAEAVASKFSIDFLPK